MSGFVSQQSTVRNGLLAALKPEDWARLAPHFTAVKLSLDDIIQEVGGPIEAVYFPEAGMVSLIVTLQDGEQVEAGLAGPEGMVGLELVYGNDQSLHDARVQLEGEALGISAAAFRTELDQSVSLRLTLLRYALAFHAQVALGVGCNARHPIEQRLARWMLTAHDRADGDRFAMTHRFMSLMLGVRRQGVTVAAGMLQKAGFIRYERGHMEVLDREGLETAACDCYHMARSEFSRLVGPFPSKSRRPPA